MLVVCIRWGPLRVVPVGVLWPLLAAMQAIAGSRLSYIVLWDVYNALWHLVDAVNWLLWLLQVVLAVCC